MTAYQSGSRKPSRTRAAPSRRAPDDASLFDFLAVWAPDEAIRHAILVGNREALYGFPVSV
jgi:hypothetical protein